MGMLNPKTRPVLRELLAFASDMKANQYHGITGSQYDSNKNKQLTVMPSCWNTGKLLSGFTLIELLVVIAIIAILASMLLPALKNARGMAIKSACQGTQKSIGYAHMMYMGDYNEYMADFSPDIYNGIYTGQPWIVKLAPYVNLEVSPSGFKPIDNPKSADVFCCPKKKEGIFLGNFVSYHVSYVISDNVTPRKIVICSRPSSKVYLGDAADACGGYWPNRFSPNLTLDQPPATGTDIEIRHNMAANFLFLDGHVNSYGKASLPLANPAWADGLKWLDPSYSPTPDNL